jgi:hypothetical protein
MSIHERIAERIRERARLWRYEDRDALEDLADEVTQDDYDYDLDKWSGVFDDIIGVPEPTVDDVTREAVRVLGVSSGVDVCQGRVEIHAHPSIQIYVNLGGREWPKAIAAAYAALRALPDYEAKP